jgi:hypothetical protein
MGLARTLVVLLLISTFAACSTTSSAQYSAWKQAGFDAHDAELWSSGEDHFTPTEAARWKRLGFAHAYAVLWGKLSGFSPEEAASWRQNGFDLGQARSCVKSALNVELARSWRTKGFNCSEAGVCRAASLNPDGAARWKGSGFNCEESAKWRAAGVTPHGAEQFKNEDVAPQDVKYIKALLAAGYSREKALAYGKRRMTPNQAKAEERSKSRFNSLLRRECHGHVENEFILGTASPYSVVGKCYSIGFAEVSQWLGPATALVGGSLLVEFSRPPSSNYLQRLVVKGIGAFSYETVFGAERVIPEVRVLTHY